MDTLEFFKNLNIITDKINNNIYPLSTNEWLPKINTGIATIELMKWYSDNNNFIHTHFNDISKNINSISDIMKISNEGINNILKIKNINNDIFNKINSNGYWGNIAKLSLINSTQIFDNDEDLLVSDIIENNFEDINNTIEQLDKNPIDFFNNIVISIKTYMDNNPSVKYSAKLTAFIISIYITVLITNLFSNTDNEKQTVNQIFNLYKVNNYSTENSSFSINCKSISLKNYPRDNSKSVCNLLKNDKVKILKDSLKWAFIIKENSVETGWIRKEYINFSK